MISFESRVKEREREGGGERERVKIRSLKREQVREWETERLRR